MATKPLQSLDERIKRIIAESVASVDLEWLAYCRTLTPAQRVQLAARLSAEAENQAYERLIAERPNLSEWEARFIVRAGREPTTEEYARHRQSEEGKAGKA